MVSSQKVIEKTYFVLSQRGNFHWGPIFEILFLSTFLFTSMELLSTEEIFSMNNWWIIQVFCPLKPQTLFHPPDTDIKI